MKSQKLHICIKLLVRYDKGLQEKFVKQGCLIHWYHSRVLAHA